MSKDTWLLIAAALLFAITGYLWGREQLAQGKRKEKKRK